MTDCPPHPRDSVEKISGTAGRTDADYFICSECGYEFEGKYDDEKEGYIEPNSPN